MGKGFSPVYEIVLKELAGLPTTVNCSSVAQHCNRDTTLGIRTRQVCPVTCGCDNPAKTLVLSNDFGCPARCAQTTQYQSAIQSRECVDEPLGSAWWTQYFEGFQSVDTDYN